MRGENSRHGEAEDVRETEARGELGARAGDPEQRQERDPDGEVEDVREEQSRKGAGQRLTRATK